jgi:hypothetical protein
MEMLRQIIDMVPFRSLAEEVVNCWLSYTMSQPVQFDLTVLFLFALQYIGARELLFLIRQYKIPNILAPSDLNSELTAKHNS